MNRASVIALLAAVLLPLGALAGPVNVNTADAKTIARELTGIGLSRAQAIVDYREKNGPFKTADDLAKVKGIGMKVVEQNRANIRTDKSEKSKTAASESAKAAPSD
jgi:competence protein ComEA